MIFKLFVNLKNSKLETKNVSNLYMHIMEEKFLHVNYYELILIKNFCIG